MNLNIAEWKPFTVGQIFNIYNGAGITKEEIECNQGDFIAVQSGEENNGCIGRIDRDYCKEMSYTFTDEPCLTVARSGSAGFVSFQPFGCVVGDSAKILLLKDEKGKHILVYLFLRTLLLANRYKYTYGRKVTEAKYLAETLMLPVKADDKPDWDFMIRYMKSLKHNELKTSNRGGTDHVCLGLMNGPSLILVNYLISRKERGLPLMTRLKERPHTSEQLVPIMV